MARNNQGETQKGKTIGSMKGDADLREGIPQKPHVGGWLASPGPVVILMVMVSVLSSCIGIESDITIRKDGSGSIVMTYQVNRMIESLGKLDGNEKFLPFPVGKVDFERTASRIPGLNVRSYTMKQEEQHTTVKAELTFQNLQALGAFLDSTGHLVRITTADEQKTLTLQLSRGPATTDRDLQELVRSICGTYTIGISITTPTVPSYQATGIGEGKVGSLKLQRETLRFMAPTADILLSKEPVEYSLSWK